MCVCFVCFLYRAKYLVCREIKFGRCSVTLLCQSAAAFRTGSLVSFFSDDRTFLENPTISFSYTAG